MKVLILVRHAKSSWDDPGMTDKERPLSNRGKRDAPEMGERLKKQGIIPALMICSPAKRAKSTAKKFAKQLSYPKEKIRIEEGIYEGSQEDLLVLIKNLQTNPDSVMVFGHNPVITEFANALSGINIHNIPTCGVVSIQFDINEWQQIDYKKGKLVFFDYPKKGTAQVS
jgi:phosphohistidine phosphatase